LRAKSDLVFSLGATLEHPSRVANATSELFVDALPLDYYARYSATLAALTSTEIEATAARTRAQGLTVVVVGDRAKIEPELRQHGYSVELAASELSE
jgi:predicted Zn-dependent peptidase